MQSTHLAFLILQVYCTMSLKCQEDEKKTVIIYVLASSLPLFWIYISIWYVFVSTLHLVWNSVLFLICNQSLLLQMSSTFSNSECMYSNNYCCRHLDLELSYHWWESIIRNIYAWCTKFGLLWSLDRSSLTDPWVESLHYFSFFFFWFWE